MPTHSSRGHDALNRISANDLIGQFRTGLTKKKPWKDITEFVTSPRFLGFEPYPKQMTLLKLIFLETENMTAFDLKIIEGWRAGFGGKESYGVQPDIWERIAWLKERGYRRFPHIQNVMGRRGGKGWIGGVLAAELVAYMVSLDDWHKVYGIQPGKKCEIAVLATQFDQAKKYQFADASEAINACAYLKPYISQNNEYLLTVYTPHDLRQLALRKSRGLKAPEKDTASIRMQAMASGSGAGRGGAGVANFFDEFAFMLNGTGGPADSDNVYKAYQPALRQFKKDGLTYIPSSPATKVGKFYDLYQAGCVLMPEYLQKIGQELHSADGEEKEGVADPTMLVYQNNSWSIYEDYEMAFPLYGFPKHEAIMEYDDAAKIEEKKNPSGFKVEFKGQFAEVTDAYLDADKVDQIFQPFWGNRTLQPAPYGRMDIQYHGHMDPSSVTANFALAIGHLENAPPDEYGHIWPHVIIDYLKVWKPSDFEDGMVDYVQITEDIKRDVFGKYPSLVKFTTDQYNLPGLLAMLKKQDHPASRIKVDEQNFNKRSNMNRAEKFKGAMNLGWLHSYKDDFFGDEGQHSLLELELKFLSEKNGQVVKQETGPVTTKDLADCVMEITVRMLTSALDNYAATMMGSVQPQFTQAGLERVVDNVSPSIGKYRQEQNRNNISEISARGRRGGGPSGPRWARG